jgi:hypothetical protein
MDIEWDNGLLLVLTIPLDALERIEPPKNAPSC